MIMVHHENKIQAATEVHLKHYPVGVPQLSDFDIVINPLPDLDSGQVLVRNHFMSVDPYMRIRMKQGAGYMAPFVLNQVMDGHAIGEVVESCCPRTPVGAIVTHFSGWRDYFVCDSTELRVIDPVTSLHHYLGVMGMPGMTAYVGLLHIGLPKPGEVVFVSAASGAVGSVVCQLAKLQGCTVIASAGREDKIRWLVDVVGVDYVLNYRQEDVFTRLAQIAPGGIDVYFDNVGGDHLLAAYDLMNDFGRIVMCGMISQYNEINPSISLDFFHMVSKRLLVKGFLLKDHMQLQGEFEHFMSEKIKGKDIVIQESIVNGIHHAPRAFIEMLRGEHMGKVLVKIV